MEGRCCWTVRAATTSASTGQADAHIQTMPMLYSGTEDGRLDRQRAPRARIVFPSLANLVVRATTPPKNSHFDPGRTPGLIAAAHQHGEACDVVQIYGAHMGAKITKSAKLHHTAPGARAGRAVVTQRR